MKLVIQRVTEANVKISDKVCGQIGQGLVVLLGLHKEDVESDIKWIVNKLVNLRIFSDSHDKMNLSIKDVEGQILIISQFTLYGNCLGGRRPDFLESAAPEKALPLYKQFVEEVKKEIKIVQTGEFGAKMQVSLINDGPVTFILESNKSTK